MRMILLLLSWCLGAVPCLGAGYAGAILPFDRLFTTQEQRQEPIGQHDVVAIQRSPAPIVVHGSEEEVYDIQGLIMRSDGSCILWVNETMVSSAHLKRHLGKAGKCTESAAFRMSSQKNVSEIKPGQIFFPERGLVKESYETKARGHSGLLEK